MRLTYGWVLLLAAGCATVETSTVVGRTKGRERCDVGELVASVFPGEWPNVTIEVVEQRSCATAIEEQREVRRELRMSRDVAHGIGAGAGAVAGVAAMIALQQYTSRTTPRSSFNRTDGYLLLPLAGAAAGSMVVEALNLTQHVQPIAGEVRVETSHVRRDDERFAGAGLLSHRATPLAVLHGGRAQLPVELVMGVYGRPLELDGRFVDWSVRASAWVPGRLPACVRAAEVHRAGAQGLAALGPREQQQAEADARACQRDGWPFATTLLGRVAQECRARFQSTCANAR